MIQDTHDLQGPVPLYICWSLFSGMSPKTPHANLALGPLPLFLSWLPQGIDRTLPGKVQGLTETLISAALGEGCPLG